jgi:hypothetical protein
MRAVITVLCMSALSASAIGAQTPATIDPGMTREQVVATIGQPLSSRSYEGFTYLLYKNGCEKKCGMNDLVVLDSGKVVDAVFRAKGRTYSGTSSSPKMISATEAKSGTPNSAPLKVEQPVPKKPSPTS